MKQHVRCAGAAMRGQPRPGPGQNGAQAGVGGSGSGTATRIGATMDLVATPAIKPELSFVVAPSAAGASSGGPRTSSGRVVVASNAQRIQLCRAVADVTCSQDGCIEWVTCSHCHVTALAGTASFTAMAQQDGSLQLLSRAGRRKFPPLALASAVVLLAADGNKLAALLANGDVRLWDVERGKVCCPWLCGRSCIDSVFGLVSRHPRSMHPRHGMNCCPGAHHWCHLVLLFVRRLFRASGSFCSFLDVSPLFASWLCCSWRKAARCPQTALSTVVRSFGRALFLFLS